MKYIDVPQPLFAALFLTMIISGLGHMIRPTESKIKADIEKQSKPITRLVIENSTDINGNALSISRLDTVGYVIPENALKPL